MAWDYAIAAQQQTDPVLQSAPAGIFTWYDQTKVAAAQAAQGAGADGRTVLNGQALASTLNPLTGLTYNAPASLGTGSYSYTDGGGEGGGQQATWNPDGKMSDATYGFQGSNLSVIPADQLAQFGIQAEPGATYISGNGFDTPGGNGEKDQGFGIYKVSADGTSATPVGATNQYVASDWVDGGRQMAKGAAAVAGAAFGAAALGGAAGAGGAAGGGTGAGGLSGMDLAADAALGTGNNIATAGGALGAGDGATAAGGATQFGGGYDFGSGTGATFGGQGGAGVDALGTGVPAGTTMPSLASASPATVSALQTAAQQAGKTLQ
ncbi:MAG TPA: hypothetical protein VNU71_13605, partial [Burkholderiaceae bacterium]|nr:hypothetical protein [Burkholderiaceae bacterium]